MSAKTTGADAGNGGAARSREHNQGNQGRGCTPEQKAAVLRIRRCHATAFYEILAVEASCSDSEIKKAYRKQSLLTHPDKNGHEHADEAFKMVARAFSVLGDKEKRDKFDRFGTDPDSRFESARQQQQQNPFAGFANRQRAAGGGGGGGGGGFEEEISPEEMFRRFFGGGGFGGPFGGGFDTGPQFVFNMGGGPGIRVHQFGGGRPRTRPRNGAAGGDQQQQQAEASILSTLIGLLPVIFLFIIPLITSLFSGSTAPAVPDVVFETPIGAHNHRLEHDSGLVFFVREEDWAKIRQNKHKVSQLHTQAFVTFANQLKRDCERESLAQQHLHEAAQGWFYVNQDILERAKAHPKPRCARLARLLRDNGKADGQQGKPKAS
ncbi:hypothetical protein RB595_005209 [Gaeumannomyces hyphopodioides]